jgi:hypothetical protein
MFIFTSGTMFKNGIKVEKNIILLCLISLLNFFTVSLEGKSVKYEVYGYMQTSITQNHIMKVKAKTIPIQCVRQ